MSQKIKKHIDFDKADVDWYYSTFPDGSLSKLMSSLLKAYRKHTETDRVDYAQLAVKSLAASMKDGNA